MAKLNEAITERVARMGHWVGASVAGALSHDQLLTDPHQAAEFVRMTKVDALAIACGTSHGAYKFSSKPTGDTLAISQIEAIHAKIPDVHIVMQGSSSVPQCLQDKANEFGGEMSQTYGVPVEEIERGIKSGVRKVNVDTDCRMAMTSAFRKIATEKTTEFDPRKFLVPAMDDMARRYADGSLDPKSTTAAAA